MNGPPILVIDDHDLVRSALVVALAARGMSAAAVGPAEVATRLRTPAPPGGLALLDLDLGDGLDGAVLVSALRRTGWRVLVVTGSVDEHRIAAAVTSGAAGWVAKSAPMEHLVQQVTKAAQGRDLLDSSERQRLASVAARAGRRAAELEDRWSRLTPRERAVAARLADGARPVAIAEEFVVAVGTVRAQIRSILAKLEVSSQLEAAALARKQVGR